MLGPFERPEGVNPIIVPDSATTFYSPVHEQSVQWEAMATFNPASVAKDGKIYVLYRSEDKTGEMKIGGHTSRIGMAESEDGVRFTRRPAPVLYPERDLQKEYEWPGGVEDPRVVETEDSTYVMTYTQWNRELPRLAVATSKDLVHWVKHGPAFEEALDGKYLDGPESKAGAIVTRQEGSRLVATKINGKYWMYWGVPEVRIATSDDLVNWKVVENGEGEPLVVLAAREGHFDSWLVEPGPPAVMTEDGIVLIYNAGNDGATGDPDLADEVYTGGQALYDAEAPTKLLSRSDEPFFQPEFPYEKTGQYAAGTTFLEGLTPFNGKWYLYYGTADSRVGVAVWDAGWQSATDNREPTNE